MKISKAFTLFAAALFAVGAFADANNVLISFSTEADYYADGTPVLDGEWYALCWAQDGVFDGLKLDYSPVDPTEKVFKISPLAKDGHCPYVIFQVDSKEAPSDGDYFVYVLDTRNAEGTSAAAPTLNDKGKRVPATEVNGLVPSKSFTVVKSDDDGRKSSVSTIGASGAAVSDIWGYSEVDNAKQARITAFKVEDAKVKITVSDMLPGVKYNVYMGESPSDFDTYGLTTPKTGVETADFEIDPGDAKFFRVVRQPLDQPVTTAAE